MIEIYTDGAYNTVSDKGGWAAVLVEGGKEQVISGTANKTTNNRMEITAAFEGITHTPKTAEVVVHTDSQYLYGCMVKGWQRKANLDLFEKLDAAVRERKVRWLWIDQNVPNSYQKSAHTTATSLISQSEASEPAQNKASEAFEVKASETEQVRAAEPLPAKTIEPPPQKIAAAAQPKLIPPTPEKPKLSHVDETGRPRMVDVTAKAETEREALARGTVSMKPETLSLIQKGEISKGDVLTVAQIAGIMAAKQTPQLIPLCHPLLLGDVKVEFSIDEKNSVIEITSTVKTTGKTGVEMEALTAVAVAALTIYDMCKAVEKGIRIEKIRLVKKSGGKSGTITLE